MPPDAPAGPPTAARPTPVRRARGAVRPPAAACALAAAAALAAPRPAGAWSNQGHMATGLLAYDDLARRDPAALAEVLRLARALPDRGRLEAALGFSLGGPLDAARGRRLFAWMARWADDVRGGPRDHPTWHYAVRVVSPAGAVVRFTTGDAQAAFARTLALAADRAAPDSARAVALCWVMHLAGDMQQPLHAATWVSARWPKSDRAGTTVWVRRAADAEPVALHTYWDEALDRAGVTGGAAELAAADALAAGLAPRFPRAGLPEVAAHPAAVASPDAAFGAWSAEGRRLARAWVYRGVALRAARERAEAPAVDAGYAAGARALAARRLAVAAWRVSDALGAALGR